MLISFLALFVFEALSWQSHRHLIEVPEPCPLVASMKLEDYCYLPPGDSWADAQLDDVVQFMEDL